MITSSVLADTAADVRISRGAHLIAQSPSLIDAHTRIRDRNASQRDLIVHGRRIIRLLLEEALGLLPREDVEVVTPAGHTYRGNRIAASDVCAVSVVRAGEAMESELWSIFPGMPIGKILIQRDRASKQPSLHWAHLPPRIADGHVLLLEPMLATGGSLLKAIEVLLAAGVSERKIIVATVLASPVGIERVTRACPQLSLVTSSVESELDDNAYMVPGIGDFGDRWFGTDGRVTWP